MTDPNFIRIEAPKGEALVCDSCTVEVTTADNERRALRRLFQTDWGLVCPVCYNRAFRPAVEDEKNIDYGKVKLLKVFQPGESLAHLSEESGTISAIIQCPHCNIIAVVDLGMISQDEAREKAKRCPQCGKDVRPAPAGEASAGG